ncbi:MAG: Fis family transcriptional regulator [Gammaproteobacteria bacterium]|nr:Fis family transcriptional regulator [Gammaproteobacteria bacterium]
MRKTDKKIDNQLRLELTEVCDIALKEIDGFQWLTHTVNYANFPKSLKIICVFETNQQLASFTASSSKKMLSSLIQSMLSGMAVKCKNVESFILYDTEQNCDQQHNGNWASRLG